MAALLFVCLLMIQIFASFIQFIPSVHSFTIGYSKYYSEYSVTVNWFIHWSSCLFVRSVVRSFCLVTSDLQILWSLLILLLFYWLIPLFVCSFSFFVMFVQSHVNTQYYSSYWFCYYLLIHLNHSLTWLFINWFSCLFINSVQSQMVSKY